MNGMEPWTWEVLAVLSAVALVNTFGFIAWRGDLVGEWYPGAVTVATLAMLVGDDHSHWLRTSGAVVAFLLGLYGLVAWIRHRQSHRPGIHRYRRP